MHKSIDHFGDLKRIHLIGIGGSGMVGLARILLKKGFLISGSDLVMTDELNTLKKIGARIQLGHHPRYIKHTDLVVASSAISRSNDELVFARRNKKTIVPRAEMLSSLTKGYRSIAIAGSHGKTTTTSLIANIFDEAKLSPTYVIGGQILSGQHSSKLGEGLHMVIEADESDGSFLHLQPEVAVITNIDNDHLNFYNNDQIRLNQGFLNFIGNLPFYGYVLLNHDDKNIKKIKKNINRRFITFGFSQKSDYQICIVDTKSDYQNFKIIKNENDKEFSFQTSLIGIHNIINASAAAIIGIEEGVNLKDIKRSLKGFSGVARRFERHRLRINERELMLIDDYGHHPKEIELTIEATKHFCSLNSLCMIFEPHRFSRTKQLFNAFVDILKKIPHLYLLDIYPASEKPIRGIHSKNLVKAINQAGGNAQLINSKQILRLVQGLDQKFNFLLMQGAGRISHISASLVKKWNIKK